MAGQYNAMLKSRSNHYLVGLFDSSPGFNAYLRQNICSFSSCWFTNLGCWFAFFILFIIITTITQSFLDPLGPKICPKI